MNQEEFYITLPSNVKNMGITENTMADYVTYLKSNINFNKEEKWKVGLTEISYTKSWYNLQKNSTIKFCNESGTKIGIKSVLEKSKDRSDLNFNTKINFALLAEPKILIRSGYYPNVEMLIKEINDGLIEAFNEIALFPPEVIYNDIAKKIELKCGRLYRETLENNKTHHFNFYPIFEDELQEILGLKRMDVNEYNKMLSFQSILCKIADKNDFKYTYLKKSIEKNNEGTDGPFLKYSGQTCVQLNAGFHSLFVYSNIVEHGLVGDASAQLLRVVEIPSNTDFGEQITILYNSPHYVPIESNSIKNIAINIKDDTGDNFPFEFGRVIIKLCFKKYG